MLKLEHVSGVYLGALAPDPYRFGGDEKIALFFCKKNMLMLKFEHF